MISWILGLQVTAEFQRRLYPGVQGHPKNRWKSLFHPWNPARCQMETSWAPFPAEIGPAALGAASTWMQRKLNSELRNLAPHIFLGICSECGDPEIRRSYRLANQTYQTHPLNWLNQHSIICFLLSEQNSHPAFAAASSSCIHLRLNFERCSQHSVSPNDKRPPQDALISKASWKDLHILSRTNPWKPLWWFHRQISSSNSTMNL